jgi:uncharacterized protein YfaP (DUF2135 family)
MSDTSQLARTTSQNQGKQAGIKDIVRTSGECWRQLLAFGEIDVKHYDRAIVEAIANKLNLDPNIDLAGQLDSLAIETETFLNAFFKAAAPFTEMLQDLLAFFERAGAAQSATGTIEISFDFGKNVEGLKFDLSTFRTWQWQWHSALLQQSDGIPAWNHDYLRRIAASLRSAEVDPRPLRDSVTDWLGAYEKGRWPDTLPDAPRIGPGRWGRVLLLLWNLWSQVVADSRALGADRGALTRYRWMPGQAHKGSGSVFDPWLLKLLDADGWTRSVLRGMHEAADDPQRSDALSGEVTTIIDTVPKTRQSVQGQIAVLEQLLSLPAWKRRCELYSAWVGSEIVGALGPQARVHAVDGFLRYSFGGTHLATAFDQSQRALHVWAELRSPLNQPKGKGRARNIQPDYSIQIEPITYPESSLLVVECKQYLVANVKGFADALTDYARGRPRAIVALVNYGKASGAIRDRVDTDVSERTRVIGDLRPQSREASQDFSALVGSLLRSSDTSTLSNGTGIESPSAPRPAGALSLATEVQAQDPWGRIALGWGVRPRDLDLHVWLTDGNGRRAEISFQQPGTLDGEPWAFLDRDCVEGEGPETVAIRRPCTMCCAVHNYSDESPLRDSGAILEVSLGSLKAKLHCPNAGIGSWWLAFEYDCDHQMILVRDRLADTVSL